MRIGESATKGEELASCGSYTFSVFAVFRVFFPVFNKTPYGLLVHCLLHRLCDVCRPFLALLPLAACMQQGHMQCTGKTSTNPRSKQENPQSVVLQFMTLLVHTTCTVRKCFTSDATSAGPMARAGFMHAPERSPPSSMEAVTVVPTRAACSQKRKLVSLCRFTAVCVVFFHSVLAPCRLTSYEDYKQKECLSLTLPFVRNTTRTSIMDSSTSTPTACVEEISEEGATTAKVTL